MIGTRLGNWVITKEIGEGGMGRIYLAREQPDAQPASAEARCAAVKVLPASLAQEAGFVDRFEREITALQKLSHPNIVRLYDHGRHNGAYYYVMEYVEGSTFADLLERAGRLPWGEVLELVQQVCPALKHAHDHGIIHRDLKPSNLLLGTDGVVKLLDFGVAKVFANAPITATNAVVGTADYMSPEQAAGKNVSKRSDLYSLGVVMYHLVTGRTPFQADGVPEMLHKHRFAQFDAPKKYVPDLPHDLDAVICQLLAKEPEGRPPDAHILAKELDRLRRKYVRKGQLTTDELKPSHTLVEKAPGPGDTADALEGPGPATMMSHLVRAQLEEIDRPGPIDRFFSKSWVVIPAFIVVIGLIVWGLWPKSGAQRVEEIRKLIAQQEWDDAAAKLDKLSGSGVDLPPGADLAALRAEIEDGQALRQAKRATKGASALSIPASAAERFYREGVQEYNSGRHDAARAKWRQVIDAFGGLEEHRQWVLLAQDSLKKADNAAKELATVDEALRLAEKESAKEAERRLKALLELYQSSDAAKKRIEAALAKLKERSAE
jgi:serine/threonine-protein kinase